MQDLEIEVNNLRCIDNAWESSDDGNTECFVPVQRVRIMLTVRIVMIPITCFQI